MIGYNFEYCGKCLRDFGYIMAKPDTEDNFGLSRSVIKGDITPFKISIPHFGTKYDDSLSLNIFIVKDVVENKKDTVMSHYELRDILAWLTSVKTPNDLIVESYDGDFIEYCGIFTNVEPFSANKLNGLKLTFLCDSQYAYKRQILKFNNSSTTSFTLKNFYCDSDELNEYIYPVIKIRPQNCNIFKIKNITDSGSINLNFEYINDEIMIDCKLRRITIGGVPSSFRDIGWEINQISDYNGVNTESFEIYWLRLLPGHNKLSFLGNGTFTIECKIPLKIGGYINNV